MAELTINTLIKIIIGVVVISVIAFAVFLSFRNYIIPYFTGIVPNETRDFSSQYYEELIQEQNLVANLEKSGEGKITFVNYPNVEDYYIKDKYVRINDATWYSFRRDTIIGTITGDKIIIKSEQLNKNFLEEINRAEIIGKEIYNIK